MLAHVGMREAKVWVQTILPATVRVAYTKSSSNTPNWSIPTQTKASEANTATITLDGVEPGLTYSYQIEIDGRF